MGFFYPISDIRACSLIRREYVERKKHIVTVINDRKNCSILVFLHGIAHNIIVFIFI